MEENKHIWTEHVTHAIQHTSSYTSSQNSPTNSNDIEKRARSNEDDSSTLAREDDAVTAKTWAVVVVGQFCCFAVKDAELLSRFSLHHTESPSGRFHFSAQSNLRWPPNSAPALPKEPGLLPFTAWAARSLL
jgi:hypothetical protein